MLATREAPNYDGVAQIHILMKTHQPVHFKWMNLIVCQFYLSETVKQQGGAQSSLF